MSIEKSLRRSLAATLLGAGLALSAGQALAAATLVINNIDGAGEGFNDPTPVAPVGGNTGTTLGEQRLIAFQHAANIWGANLDSSVVIIVNAAFNPLTCTATSAVLGSAGATQVFSDFAGAQKAGTWYSFALANKLAGVDLDPGQPQINAQFNSNLGQANCLAGSPFYLGLDGNEGTGVDLVAVLLHEFGHGLGFQTFTGRSGANLTGAWFAGQPSIWDHFLQDNATGKFWADAAMTDAERAASALNFRNLAWTGANVLAAAPSVLTPGTAALAISGPRAGPTAGQYPVGTASFGPQLGANPVVGDLMPIVAQAAVPGDPNPVGPGCQAFDRNNALAARGNIALIDRGTCAFTVKVKNAQNAGAVGVVIADNVAGSPAGLGGADATVTIPSVRITLAAGNALKEAMKKRSRTRSGVTASLAVNLNQLAGADLLGRPVMYTPDPFAPGSSISHWDTLAFPNLLMEPSINSDLTQSVQPPQDLTLPLFRDIGW